MLAHLNYHLLLGLVLASPVLAVPHVTLDAATIVGTADNTTVQYLGLPYAQPPVGNLRLRLPVAIEPYSGTINATAYGNRCIQQGSPPLSLPSAVGPAVLQYLASLTIPLDVPQDEDCLNLNVISPANATADSKLPVVVWIYGGSFQVGSNIAPGQVLVTRSVELGHPIIYVAMNYRLSAFGFLGGKEVKQAGVGNLGLQDQREALRWIQKYISAFGGDPAKVTIWGESAGAMSVGLHMLANNGDPKGLFRAGYMESGSPFPSGYIDNELLQSTYDGIVDDCGCTGADDTLDCLRTVPAETLTAAMNRTQTLFGYEQISIPWIPRADGLFVQEPAERQVARGAVARIPIISGNDKDEGTMFAFGTLNVTTDSDFLDYIGSVVFKHTPKNTLRKVLDLYPADPAAGSPFDTGDDFAYTPQYKRMAAFEGDLSMQAPRRLLLSRVSGKQPVYSYLSNINRIEGLGAPHASEILSMFSGGIMGDYLIRFVSTLDPNGNGAFYWPRYTRDAPQLLTFSDGDVPFSITPDTFRGPQLEYLTNLSLRDPM